VNLNSFESVLIRVHNAALVLPTTDVFTFLAVFLVLGGALALSHCNISCARNNFLVFA